MSVQQVGEGKWQVKWREHGKQKGRHFDSLNDAKMFDLSIKEAKRNGQPTPLLPRDLPREESASHAPQQWGGLTLHAYMTQDLGKTPSFYKRRQAKLAPSNRRQESNYWDKHVEPFFRGVPMAEIDIAMLEDFRDTLLEEEVGPTSVERCQKIVSKVLNDAVKRGHIPHNPAQAVAYAKRAKRPICPFEPSEMEKVEAQLHGRDRVLAVILGQAGPRPGEVIGTGNSPGIRWKDMREGDSGRMKIHVYAGKTGTYRVVRVSEKLQRELEQWREQITPDPDDLIVPSNSGGRWTDSAYRNWRRRTWAEACERAGVGKRRPYDLRHGFASILIHKGHSLPDVAAQLGNSVQICASTYAHVIEELSTESSSNVPW